MATLTADINKTKTKSSKGPANDDLQTELQKVLSDSNFSFDGNFYHGSILSNPPNPCLTIEGLGLVGLPLGERDVKAIIATFSTSVPSRRGRGKGSRAKAKKEVRNTWEIEPSEVTFGNTSWQTYIDTTLCSTVCKSLGVSSRVSRPKLELSNLLVYETGAQLLTHQEAQKVDGVFGTAVILLPSAYTGGQVVVSHAFATETIDFAKDSMLSTALLAWYKEVKYEVKPIESGYRVALVYDMIHVPRDSGAPVPCLPDMTKSTRELQRVLEKWKNDKDNKESSPFIAYLLKERQDQTILKIVGSSVLKGVDLHRATFVRPVAEEMGFRVYTAVLEHKISGYSEDNYNGRRHYGGRRRGWHHSYYTELDFDSEDDDTPQMTEIDSVTTEITKLKDMDGVPILFGSSIDVGSNCLVPNNPFEDEDPDETENEGYVCSQLVYCYRRTALVLMPEDTADDILYKAQGASYAHQMLLKSTEIPPTPNDRKWANRLLVGGQSLKESDILLLLKSALRWQDVEFWKSTAGSPSCTLSMVISNTLVNPMDVFTFEDMRPSFEALLERSKSLTEKMDFLSKIFPKGPSRDNDTMNVWYHQEVEKILSSYSFPKAQDVPTLLSIIRLFGLQAFRNRVMPNLIKDKSHAFWIAFVKALWENRTAILEHESSLIPPIFTNIPAERNDPSSPIATSESTIHNILKQGLEFASIEWNYPDLKNLHYYNPYSFNDRVKATRVVKLDRIIQVVDQAIMMSELGTCTMLFNDILTSKHFNTFQKAKDVFSPLLPPLRELLAKKGLDLFQSPFVDFTRSFVGLYLRDVLGKRGELSSQHMYKIGCMGNCDDCKSLDNFIMDPTKKTTLLRAPKARRLHLERQAEDGKNLFTYEVIKSTNPNGLQLTKLPAVIEASTWPSRQKAAKLFLGTIGSDNDISRIMGNRFVDVKYALEGSRPFDTATGSSNSGATTTQKSAQSQTSRANVPQATPSVVHSTTAVPRKASATGFPQQVTSKKRKT